MVEKRLRCQFRGYLLQSYYELLTIETVGGIKNVSSFFPENTDHLTEE